MVKVKVKSLMLGIVLALLITSIPSKGLAEDNLEKHIEKVKALFEIGAEYEDFNKHDYGNYDGRKITSLSWSSNGNNINVEIDEKGEILGYGKNQYSTGNTSPVYKFPKISKEDGEKLARDFIKKLYPDILDQVTLRDESDSYGAYFSDNLKQYGFSFVEERNGIIFNENNLYLAVDTQTGEISNLNMSWTKGLEFPNTEDIISKEEAKKVYKDNVDLELLYKTKEVDKNIESYLGYNVKNTDETVHAKTGEVISTSHKPTYSVYGSRLYQNMENISSEEESKLISSKKLVSRKEAEKKLVDAFQLGDQYEVDVSRLKGNKENDIYVWDVMVMKRVGNSGSGTGSTVDARTGEIIDFSDPGAQSEDSEESKYSKEELLAKAKEIVRTNNPEKYKQVEYMELPNDNLIYGRENISYFSFLRKINDLRVENDGFRVLLNNSTGDILSYGYNWSDLEFESPKNIIDKNEAKEILFKNKELELDYQKPLMEKENKDIKLVYDFKEKYMAVDAKTATLVDINKISMDRFVTKEYKDIGKSFAKEQIKELQKFIFLFEGDQFKPKEELSQGEFLKLLGQTKNIFLYQDESYMYERFIHEGILKKDEKNLKEKVTREKAVNYIIRAFGQDPIENVGDIYKLEFKDTDKISPNLKGHVAIAKGLGLIHGEGNFRPQDNLTREEAAILIHNILNRD